jgi:hypothetical protein
MGGNPERDQERSERVKGGKKSKRKLSQLRHVEGCAAQAGVSQAGVSDLPKLTNFTLSQATKPKRIRSNVERSSLAHSNANRVDFTAKCTQRRQMVGSLS